MKTCFKLLAIIASILAPSVLMAQKITPDFVPFSSGKQVFTEIAKSKLKLLPLNQEGTQSAFRNQLPSILPDGNRKFLSVDAQTNPAYYNNMPVVKPGKTTKILIAELDPNSPYVYGMPVKKVGVAEK